MSTACCYRIVAAIAVVCALSACDISVDGDGSTKVNGSVHVPAGKAADDARTVNGSIHVDDNAAVTSAATVNGSVRLGAHDADVAADGLDAAPNMSRSQTNLAVDIGEGPGDFRAVVQR